MEIFGVSPKRNTRTIFLRVRLCAWASMWECYMLFRFFWMGSFNPNKYSIFWTASMCIWNALLRLQHLFTIEHAISAVLGRWKPFKFIFSPIFCQHKQTNELFPLILFFLWMWFCRTQPQKSACQAMKDHRCCWTRGKVIGGSSVLNTMLYVRGNRRGMFWFFLLRKRAFAQKI